MDVNREKGMTLIEVLIALTILGLALLALAPLFSGAVRTNASSNQLASANTLAREKLEELGGYPRNDPRLTVPAGANAAVGTGVATTGPGSVVAINTLCDNDLPLWYQPSTGATSRAATSPGAGWFSYPYRRTYTVEQYAADLTTRISAPNSYAVKLLTVTVRPTQGPFPGLRGTTQSLYVRSRGTT
jgi:prepilin-type N-terminal cleavage/methylation domain-containing protein